MSKSACQCISYPRSRRIQGSRASYLQEKLKKAQSQEVQVRVAIRDTIPAPTHTTLATLMVVFLIDNNILSVDALP